MSYSKQVTCPDCGGRGRVYMALHSPPIEVGCGRCQGTGVWHEPVPLLQGPDQRLNIAALREMQHHLESLVKQTAPIITRMSGTREGLSYARDMLQIQIDLAVVIASLAELEKRLNS